MSKQWCGCQHLGFSTSEHNVDACDCNGECMDIVTECALKADSRRNMPCCTTDSNLHQHCTWLFHLMRYWLSYPGSPFNDLFFSSSMHWPLFFFFWALVSSGSQLCFRLTPPPPPPHPKKSRKQLMGDQFNQLMPKNMRSEISVR